MLVGDFAPRLVEFAANGSFGVEELDEHMAPLWAQLAAAGADPAGQMYGLLLSFLINQGTEWDVFAMPYTDDAALHVVLAHGRDVTILPGSSGAMLVLAKLPIRHRVIELVPSFQPIADPQAIRAPAACFLCYQDMALFRAHMPALQYNHYHGQAYAFLLRIELAEVNGWLAAFRPGFEPFNVSTWIDTRDAQGRSVVLNLVTTSLPAHEI